MDTPKKLPNPFELRKTKALTKQIQAITLEGGRVGSGQQAIPEQVAASIADESSEGDEEFTLATCLDALLGMFHAVQNSQREVLDREYETLVTCLEVWRDAIPKA